MVTAKGMIKWTFKDDMGQKHTFLIPGSYLASGAPGRLLSPQHWSKVTRNNTRDTKGTWQATYDNKVVLHLDNNTLQQTVQLDPLTNVATLRSAPCNKAFRLDKAMMEIQGAESDPICFNLNIVSDDDETVGPDKTEDNEFDNETSPMSNFLST